MTFINPTYVNDGQTVYIDCRIAGIHDQKRGCGLKCTVEAAHGYHALVVNKNRGFRKLMHIEDLWVPPIESEKQWPGSKSP